MIILSNNLYKNIKILKRYININLCNYYYSLENHTSVHVVLQLLELARITTWYSGTWEQPLLVYLFVFFADKRAVFFREKCFHIFILIINKHDKHLFDHLLRLWKTSQQCQTEGIEFWPNSTSH